MPIELTLHSRPAVPAHIFTELKFIDEPTQIQFSTDNGSLHVYIDGWADHKAPLSMIELEQIRKALGRFIDALIPEEVK